MADGGRAHRMASRDSPNSSPPNLSFRILPSAKFLRSVSTKEPSFSELFPPSISPPRLSTLSLHTSTPPSPLHHFATAAKAATHTAAAATTTTSVETSYRCISSLLKKDGQILSMAISNNLIYTGSESNVIRVWKLPELIECEVLRTRTSMAVALAVSNDRVYAAFSDGKIRVWRKTWDGVSKHVRLGTIPKTSGYVRSYIAGKDKTMKHTGPITSIAINPTDDILYSASVDKTVKVWRISDFKCMETFQAHQEPINALLVADDDGVLFTASDDATVRVWRRNLCGGAPSQAHSLTVTLPAKHSPVKSLTLAAPDGDVLYGGCSDGYIHYWLKGWFTGQLQYGGSLQGHTHAVLCMASVGNFVISGSADSTCRIWVRGQDVQHTCLATLVGHRGPIKCALAYGGGPFDGDKESNDGGDDDGDDIRQDGCTVCTGSLDGVLKLWRVTSMNGGGGKEGSTKNRNEYFDL